MSTYAWSARRPRAADVGRAGRDLAIGALAAAAVGLLVGTDPFYALLPVGFCVAVFLAVRPRPASVALGASIPAVETIASGHLGLHIGAGDLLLLLLVLAATGAAVLERDASAFKALKPVRRPVLQYCVFVFVLLFAHPGFQSVVQTFQRYELVVFPLVVGSYLVFRGVHVRVLKAYVVAATAVAVLHPFVYLQLQKNPAGQFVGNAILVVIGVPQLSRYRILLPLLVFGLFATQSRGALLATGGGIVILLALRFVHSPVRAVATGVTVAAIAILAFAMLSPNAQSFVTTFGSQGKSHAAYNIRFRQEYQRDALHIIRQHPWLGVGVGSYASVVAQEQLTPTQDPHDVLLLQAAEGGWLFAVSFVVLIAGTAYALVRMRRLDLAPVAVAVLLATTAHGMVDEYWVRGTPVLSWLLAGMVCALAWRQRHLEAAEA